MASTFTTGFGIEKIGSGEQSGTWGTTTNHNLDIVDRIASYKAVAITTNADTATLTVREASPGSGTENLQDGMYRVIKFTGALDSNCTVTIAPNTAPAWFIIENATTDSGSSGPYSLILSQGSGANVTVQNGKNAIIYCDGAGSGAAVVDALADLQIGTLEVTGVAAIDGALTGSSTIQGTTITATTAFVPDASDGAALGTTSLEFSDLYLADGAVIGFGDDQDVTLTHVADTGLLLNSTMALQFNDASQYINAPSATVLDINATDEVEVNATLMDVNANIDVSGTYTGGGLMTTGGNIVIPNAGNIGSASDTDAIAISSGGVVTMNQIPVFSAGINVSGGTIAGTLATAAQGNVTSLGTLTTLTVDNVIINGTTIGHTSDTDLLTLTSGVLTVAGELDATTLDISGNADIDGTTNLDAVDIDGAVQADGTITVGVDDTGHDVKFFGATSGKYMLWDESADALYIESNASVPLTITSTDAGAGIGPAINLHRNSASPAANDVLGGIYFNGEDAGSNATTYAYMNGFLVDPTGGGEDGALIMYVSSAGSTISALSLNGLPATGGAVFNESGADLDFRVESDGNANMLFVDGGANLVGIGTAAPEALLNIVTGSAGTWAAPANFNDVVIESNTNAGLVIGLPDADEGVIGISSPSTNGGVGYGMLWDYDAGIGRLFTSKVGASTRLEADNQVTNLTLAGASGSQTATFSGAVKLEKDTSAGSSPVTLELRATENSASWSTSADFAQLQFYSGDASSPAGASVRASWGARMTGSTGGSSYLVGQVEGTDALTLTNTGNATFAGGIGVLGGSVAANIGVNVPNEKYIAWYDSGTSGGTSASMRGVAGAISFGGSSYTFTGSGAVAIGGALSKGSGSFKIDHPLPAKKDTHFLVHSFVEGPQADLIYRGRATLSSGSATVDIDAAAGMTSGTFEVLCRDIQCFTSNETGWTAVRGSVSGATLTIEAQADDCTDTISWMVVGERHDPHMRDEKTEWTDEEGRVIVEPEKPAAK